MIKIFLVLALNCALNTLLFAQDFSRADVFAGYSYLNIDANGLTSRQSLNGWELSASGNFNKWFSVEGDVSGYYKNLFGANVSVYSYGAGPRINFRPLFVHALLGGDHLTGSANGVSASQDGLAGAFGGGIQWKFSPTLSVRTSADYVFSRHNILGGPSVTQNNFRASVGLVYSFGGTTQHAPSVQVSPSAVAIPMLGLQVNNQGSGGVKIVEIGPGSAAEKANLRVGDVINAVDDKPVKTAMELAAALSEHASESKIRLGYMVRGSWQTEVTLVLNPHP